MNDQASHVASTRADMGDQEQLVNGVHSRPDPLSTQVAELQFEFRQMAVLFSDEGVQLIKLNSANADVALGDLGPESGSTLPKAHVPSVSGVFVDGVGSGGGPNRLTIVEGRQDVSDKSGWLFQAVEEGPIAIAGVVTTRLTLPVLDGIIFAEMTVCDDGVDTGVGDTKVGAAGAGAVAALTVNGLGAPAGPFGLRPGDRSGPGQDLEALAQGQGVCFSANGAQSRVAGLGWFGYPAGPAPGNGSRSSQIGPEAMEQPKKQGQSTQSTGKHQPRLTMCHIQPSARSNSNRAESLSQDWQSGKCGQTDDRSYPNHFQTAPPV